MERALISREMLDYRKYRKFIKMRGENIKKKVMKTLEFTESDFIFE